MKLITKTLVVVGLAVLLCSLGICKEDCQCEKDSRVVDSCFTIQGRVSYWNGNPSMRIWIVGTKRMLGVREGAPTPDTLRTLLTGFDTEVYGTFVVCPFAKRRLGVMQIVCIQSMRNATVRTREKN